MNTLSVEDIKRILLRFTVLGLFEWINAIVLSYGFSYNFLSELPRPHLIGWFIVCGDVFLLPLIFLKPSLTNTKLYLDVHWFFILLNMLGGMNAAVAWMVNEGCIPDSLSSSVFYPIAFGMFISCIRGMLGIWASWRPWSKKKV